MTTERRAITVVQSIENIRAQPGPFLEQYVLPLDMRGIFRWSLESALEDDGWAVLESSGGFPGAWLRVREDIKGENIPKEDIRRKTEHGQSSLGFTRVAPPANFDRSRATSPPQVPDARRPLLFHYFIRQR